MTAVEDAGRAALEELRHLLDVLGPRARGEQRLPSVSVSDLPRVAAQMEDAGLTVSIEATNIPDDLPTWVDLSAYRIVQESLTNVLRHAGSGARAMVRLVVEGDELRVEVADDGKGQSPWVGGSGRGLAGMRERAELLGGRFEAGPATEGGFRVLAMLPVTETRP
jgi:signal transduction histidine kinase